MVWCGCQGLLLCLPVNLVVDKVPRLVPRVVVVGGSLAVVDGSYLISSTVVVVISEWWYFVNKLIASAS